MSKVQLSEHCRQSPATVTEGQLCGEIDFCHGPVEFGQKEKRVIAKASCTSRRAEDLALNGTVGGLLEAAVSRGDKYAMVSAFALFGRQVTEALEKDHIVPNVSVVGSGIRGVKDSSIGREAGGANSRRAVESVHLEARIVSDDEFAWRESRVVHSFDGGICEEGVAILFGRFDIGEAGKRFDTDLVGFGGSAEIAELSLACGGDVKAEGHERSLTGGR